ncbi:hypothetical protein ACVIRO_004295 [Rhizobium ruizarguesonis]
MSPQGRLIPPISLERGCLPHGRVRKYDAPGQPIEQRDITGLQAQRLELAFVSPRCIGESLLDRVDLGVSLGDELHGRLVVCRSCDEGDARISAWRQTNRSPQTENRVEDRPGCSGERCACVECHWVGCCPASTKKSQPIGFIFGRLGSRRVRRGDVNCPSGFLSGSTWPATGKQGACRLVKPRLHEKLGETRMRHIRAAIVQADFGITCQFEGSFPCATVRDCEHAHFHVHIGCDTDFRDDFNVAGMTAEFGPVSMKGVLVDI